MVHGRLALLTWIQILFSAGEKNELRWAARMALCKYIWRYWRFPGNWVRDHINQMWNFRTACYYPAGDFSLIERLVSFPFCLSCGLLFLLSVFAGFHLRGIKNVMGSWELSRRLSLWTKTLAVVWNYCRSWSGDLFIYHTVQQKCFINSFCMEHLHRLFQRCSVLDNLPRMPEWLSITKMSLWPLEV